MKLIYTVILLFCIIPTLLFGAGTPGQAAGEIELTDGLGRKIYLTSPPERIVLAGRANPFLANAVYLFHEAPERVAALAETDQGMGDFFPYLDADHNEKTRLSNSAGVEEILSLRPDLVILKDTMYQQLGPQLESLSVPVLTLGLESYTQYLRDIQLLGTIFDNPSRAADLHEYFSGIIHAVKEKTAEAEEKPRVLMLYYVQREGTEAFQIPPADWIQTFMVETAGGEAVWKEGHVSRGWQVVNFEQIARWDPDMVFLISYTAPSRKVLQAIDQSPQWSSLSAYQEGKVLPFPGDFHSWAQSDIRWFLGIQWLAQQIHPDLYSEVDMYREVIRFYHDLFGIQEEVTAAIVLPRLEEDLSGILR